MQWFSALLVFQLESKVDPTFKRKLESLVVFRSGDFSSAKQVALKLSKEKIQSEGVRDDQGSEVITLKFCHIKSLDVIGTDIENREVWAKISDEEIDNVSEPAQTI
jgi:hypothetical protein